MTKNVKLLICDYLLLSPVLFNVSEKKTNDMCQKTSNTADRNILQDPDDVKDIQK